MKEEKNEFRARSDRFLYLSKKKKEKKKTFKRKSIPSSRITYSPFN